MARLKVPLVGKLRRVLRKRFPPPATIRVEDENGDGIIGVIRSSEFTAIEPIDRQRLIHQILDEKLSKDEQRQVLIIIGVTPDEGEGYLPDPEK